MSTIDFGVAVFDVAFHPVQDVLGVGLVSGVFELHRYSSGSTRTSRALRVKLHSDSVRTIEWRADGQRLFSGSSDKSIKAVEATGQVVVLCDAAHPAPVNALRGFAEHMLVSGDDDGGLRVWDTRAPAREPAATLTAHEDVVTDLLVDAGRATLLSTSGDGTLGVHDLRKPGKPATVTEQGDDELLSVALIKGGSTVVTGTQEGVLQVWQWGKWRWGDDDEDDGPEHFTGHPSSIDAVLAVDDDAIVTGSSDGIIRLLTVHPNKLVGIIGEHGDGGLPVERLAWARDKRLLASASHDNAVKLWDVAYLWEDDDDDDGEGKAGAAAGAAAASAAGGPVRGAAPRGRFIDLPAISMSAGAGGGGSSDDDDGDDDYDDDGDDDGDDEDDDEDEEEEDGGKGAVAGGSGAVAMEDGGEGAARGRRKAGAGSSRAAVAADGASSGKPGKGKGGGKDGFFRDL